MFTGLSKNRFRLATLGSVAATTTSRRAAQPVLHPVFFCTSDSDNDIVGGMYSDRERKGETPPQIGRSRGHGREPTSRGRFRRRSSSYGGRDEGQAARTTEGIRRCQNMCFCETNPNYMSVKTGVKILRRSRIQSKTMDVRFGFVWDGNGVG